ncbi:YkgJ family cysteine cluster protein [Veillonella sp.]|uniref:YkgJ family cysteine cluster protein n=1 Tax=Veillonella sp. TaxID=1926307 RepID=UPI0025F84CF3|nr:YkgJ family cysteine cluster protein [Veillonella sp.]
MNKATLNKYIRREKSVTDFTVNGKCSGCGECCADLLPLTNKDVKRIRQYVKRHKIKARAAQADIDMICPFLNMSNKCMVYPVRPLICKLFKCDKPKQVGQARVLIESGASVRSMRALFCGEKDVVEFKKWIQQTGAE